MLAVFAFAEHGQIIIQAFRQRGGRGDRVPARELYAAENGTQRASSIAVCHDQAVGLVHRLKIIRVFLFEIGFCPLRASFEGVEVHVNGFLLTLEMKGERGEDLIHIHADHFSKYAHIDHVAHEVTVIRRHIRVVLHDGLDRHRVDGYVSSGDGLANIVRVEKCPTRCNRCQVPNERVGVHRDHNVIGILSRNKSILVDSNGVPGRQALDVGREKVLARNRDAHLENRTQDGVVGRGAAGAVLCANGDGKIVHNFIHESPLWLTVIARR